LQEGLEVVELLFEFVEVGEDRAVEGVGEGSHDGVELGLVEGKGRERALVRRGTRCRGSMLGRGRWRRLGGRWRRLGGGRWRWLEGEGPGRVRRGAGGNRRALGRYRRGLGGHRGDQGLIRSNIRTGFLGQNLQKIQKSPLRNIILQPPHLIQRMKKSHLHNQALHVGVLSDFGPVCAVDVLGVGLV